MSIRKAKVLLRAKLINKGEKLIASTAGRNIILDRETAKLLSMIHGEECVDDLRKLLKNEPNSLIKRIAELEESGIINLKFPCDDQTLRNLYERRDLIAKICKKNPSLWNVVAYEKEWDIYPDSFDFLNRDSGLFWLKSFEKEIYFDLMRRFFDIVPKKGIILDAGGGIGRFAVELVRRGFEVHLVDSSERALKKALKYLAREKGAKFDLHWGNAAHLSLFSNDSFDATLAAELICYCNNPREVVKELVRVTKKNGLIMVSVEGKYGGILSDPNVSFDTLGTIFKDDLLYKKHHLYVHYYTPASLRRLLEGCGIDVIDIFGSHYVTDGVLHGLINIDRLKEKGYKAEVFKIEKFCQKDPTLKNLARSWVAVGRKR